MGRVTILLPDHVAHCVSRVVLNVVQEFGGTFLEREHSSFWNVNIRAPIFSGRCVLSKISEDL